MEDWLVLNILELALAYPNRFYAFQSVNASVGVKVNFSTGSKESGYHLSLSGK